MTGYQEFFAKRDAAEAARVKEAVAALAGASRAEPAKKGLAGVWKVYWGVWAAIAAGCLVLLLLVGGVSTVRGRRREGEPPPGAVPEGPVGTPAEEWPDPESRPRI